MPESATTPAARDAGADTLVVVTFNVKEGERVDRAIAALRADTVTRDADILLLQEMDAHGTRRIAEAMGMGGGYFPTWFGEDGEGFGNAVLSRWPIVDDEKLILPHLAFFNRLQRTATVATLDVNGTRVRVYSIHLATRFNLAPWKRREQWVAAQRGVMTEVEDVHLKSLLVELDENARAKDSAAQQSAPLRLESTIQNVRSALADSMSKLLAFSTVAFHSHGPR